MGLAMSFKKEFQDFALKGNVVDLAVGVIIGVAFGKIVSALVENIFSPIIGYLVGGVSFTELAGSIPTPTKPILIKYGILLQALFDFMIIAGVLFMVIKGMNKLKKRMEADAAAAPPPPPPAPAPSEAYLKDIRDDIRAMLTRAQ
jgi:large conductance mechanosensitive channel